MSPVICQTAARTPTVAATAHITSTIALQALGAMGWSARNVVSTNNGVTWSTIDVWWMRGGSSLTGEWGSATDVTTLNLVAGTSYRFGVRIERDTGIADASDHRCKVVAVLTYRDAGASTLGDDSETSTGKGD
jgi:hypothetical protein